MTVSQFAQRWLIRQDLMFAESAYDMHVGQSVLRLVQFLEQEIHSVKDVLLLFAMVTSIYKAFDDSNSEIWQQYRDEQRRKAS